MHETIPAKYGPAAVVILSAACLIHFPVIKNNCFEQQFGKMCSETKDTIHYSQGGNQLAIIYKWIAVKMWYQIQAESKLRITQKNTSMDYIKTVTPFSLICEHWLFPLSSPIL